MVTRCWLARRKKNDSFDLEIFPLLCRTTCLTTSQTSRRRVDAMFEQWRLTRLAPRTLRRQNPAASSSKQKASEWGIKSSAELQLIEQARTPVKAHPSLMGLRSHPHQRLQLSQSASSVRAIYARSVRSTAFSSVSTYAFG